MAVPCTSGLKERTGEELPMLLCTEGEYTGEDDGPSGLEVDAGRGDDIGEA
jgi:hypothetical protein